MKMLFELLPVILFFVTFKFKGIYAATAVAIAASVIQIIVSYARTRKVEKMVWISLAVIVIFGGSTLALHNELFIKWKPTVLYGIFAAAIASAKVFFKKNVIREMLGGKIALPDAAWERLNAAWGVFFAALGALNIYVAYSYPTAVWVNFKLFGIMGLMLVFVVAQSVFLAPYIDKDGK